MNIPENIRRRIQFTGDCWLWTGELRTGGYPTLCGVGRIRNFMLNQKHGFPAPTNKTRSTCENTKCVNPAHLYWAGTFPNIDEFYKRTEPCPATGCMLWLGYQDSDGYGMCAYQGKKRAKAHRIAWMIANGMIPDGLQVHHICNTPSCVAVHHLSLGTDKENKEWAVRCNRTNQGTKNPHAKLTDADIFQILTLANTMKYQDIADLFNVAISSVSMIINRRTWKHLD